MSPEQELRKKNTSIIHYRFISAGDLPFLGVMLVLISSLSFLLYLSWKYTEKGSSTEVIGYLANVGNIVQRRAEGSPFWQDTKIDEPAYAQDLIRTGENSSMILNLQGGVNIDLDANSMILLSYSDTGATSSIDVQYGSLYVDASGGEESADTPAGQDALDKEIMIKSGENELSVAGGLVRVDSDAKGEVNVTGVKGDAVVTSNGLTRQVGKNQQVAIAGGSLESKTGQLSIESVVSPQPNKTFFIEQPNQSVLFEFGLAGSPASLKNLSLEISPKRSFAAGTVKRVSLARNALGSKKYRVRATLSAGTYYWRVAGTSTEGGSAATTNRQIESNWKRFLISYRPRLRFQIPANNTVIATNQEKERVKFVWAANRNAGSRRYHLRVATDKSMKDLVQEENSRINRIHLVLAPGSYFAQLSYITDGKIVKQGSTTIAFQILFEDEPKSLAVYSPKNGQDLYQNAIEGEATDGKLAARKHGYWFRWENYRGASNVRILISKERGMNNIIQTKESQRNYFWLAEPELKALPEGSYFWRVEYLNENGNLLAASAPRSVQILESQPATLNELELKKLAGFLQVGYDALKETYSETTILLKSGRTIKGLIVYQNKSRMYLISGRRIIDVGISEIESFR